MPELDLHGLYPQEALEKLELFLFDCYQNKKNKCRIIYGFGTGKLREVVLENLKNNPLIDEVVEEEGSCVAVFSDSRLT